MPAYESTSKYHNTFPRLNRSEPTRRLVATLRSPTRFLHNQKIPQVGAADATSAETNVETAVYAISNFVHSLNATAVAVSGLDYYTNAEVNGSLLLAPNCTYNVTFEGEEATTYLGRPWLALPTVSTAASVATEGGNGGNTSSSSGSGSGSSYGSTNQTTVSAPQTPWDAGGTRQSFGREESKYVDFSLVGSGWWVGTAHGFSTYAGHRHRTFVVGRLTDRRQAVLDSLCLNP